MSYAHRQSSFRFASNLSGCHVLLTGGNKGIGRVAVESFLREGANVSYCGRSVRGDEFASYEGMMNGASARGTQVDIADPTALKVWVDESVLTFGRADVVIANGKTMPVHMLRVDYSDDALASPEVFDPTTENWHKSFEANIMGFIALIDAATPHLAKSPNGGSIVVTSSIAGSEARHPSITGPYPTMKRAQATIAKDYSKTLAPKGIRVNIIVCGTIATPNTTLPDGSVVKSTFNQKVEEFPERFEKLYETIPMGRAGTAEDVVNTMIFLGSSLSGFITGAKIAVDGGWGCAY